MKNIFLGLCFLALAYNSFSQEQELNCDNTFISTDPENPVNERCTSPLFLNNLEWRLLKGVTSFTVPHYQSNDKVLYSPYDHVAPAATLMGIPSSIQQDQLVEDGWELITENIIDRRTDNTLVNCVYMVFYNKFSSTLRIWAALSEPTTDVESYQVRLFFEDGSISGLLHPAGGIAQSLDKKSIPAVATYSTPSGNVTNKFFLAEFPVEYDPCTCNKPLLAKLKVEISRYRVTEVNLTTSSVGLSRNIGSLSSLDSFLVISQGLNSNSVTGTLFYKETSELFGMYQKELAKQVAYKEQLERLKKAKAALDLLGAAATTALVVYSPAMAAAKLKSAKEKLNNAKDISKGVGGFMDYFSYKVQGKYDQSVNKANIIGSSHISYARMETSGTLSSRTGAGGFFFHYPGADNCQKDRRAYPLYDKPLGRFAVLETPKVEVGSSERSATVTNNSSFEVTTYVQNKIHFDKTNFLYTFNPSAGINEQNTVIYAALVINGTRTSGSSIRLNDEEVFNANLEGLSNDRVTFISDFTPLDCLSHLSVKLEHIKNINSSKPGKSEYVGDMAITDVYLKLVIVYEFNQLGRNGLPNRAVQVLTYPMKIEPKAYNEIPEPISNNGSAIVDSLHVGTTNYTTSQTVFAWEKIVINGNITTASGVEVRFVAPEVSVIGGSLGQGVSTEIGFFPTSCAPLLPASATAVSNFCTDNQRYKANQSKYPRPDDQPIAESDKETLNGVAAFDCQPNPFTQQFQARFTLSEESEVQLSLYNLMGSRVKDVVVGEMLPAGEQRFEVGTEELPSGVYFLTLQTKSGRQTVKVLKQ